MKKRPNPATAHTQSRQRGVQTTSRSSALVRDRCTQFIANPCRWPQRPCPETRLHFCHFPAVSTLQSCWALRAFTGMHPCTLPQHEPSGSSHHGPWHHANIFKHTVPRPQSWLIGPYYFVLLYHRCQIPPSCLHDVAHGSRLPPSTPEDRANSLSHTGFFVFVLNILQEPSR